jgi:hypothetical protein
VQPQASVGDLLAQLVGPMEVGAGEPLRPPGGVAVLTVAEVARDDRLEAGFVQEAAQ